MAEKSTILLFLSSRYLRNAVRYEIERSTAFRRDLLSFYSTCRNAIIDLILEEQEYDQRRKQRHDHARADQFILYEETQN